MYFDLYFCSWCGPCKIISPVLQKAAAENEDVTFVKVDVDEHPDIADAHKVTKKH